MPLIPRPAARAIGTFPMIPIAIVTSPANKAVAAATATGGGPTRVPSRVTPRIAGLRKMM